MQKEEQWVVISVGESRCGLFVDDVREIVKPQVITPLPHSQEFVEGLMNLRGQIVPVINLGVKLGLSDQHFMIQAEGTKRLDRIVVIASAGELIGLHVDSVHEVITVSWEELEHLSEGELKERGYVEAVYQAENALVLKLNTSIILQPLCREVGQV